MAGQLLGSRFALHDVEDVEAFCASIVQRVRFKLAAHEREELHVYLIETAWEVSLPQLPPRRNQVLDLRGKYAQAPMRRLAPLTFRPTTVGME
jgi:hypothetical protein